MTPLPASALADASAAAPTPSIETPVHALVPHRYVDHTHADAVLVLTNQPGGVDLVRYYDDGGFPAIFGSATLADRERKTLSRVFSIIKTERWMPRFLGTLHHERLTIRSFEAGTPYVVRVNAKGKPVLAR